MPKKNKCHVCQKESDDLLFVPGKEGRAIYLCEYCNKTYLGVKSEN